MTLQLTDQQIDEITTAGTGMARVHDPRSKRDYVLVPQDEYDRLRELLDDDLEQEAIRKMALRGAVLREQSEP